MTTLLQPISHAEKEAAATNNMLAALARRDHAEFARIWAVYAQIHRERPAGVVRAMEADMLRKVR